MILHAFGVHGGFQSATKLEPVLSGHEADSQLSYRELQNKPVILYIYTVDSKIIRAFVIIILAIFLWFDSQFLSFHACYKKHKV